MKLFKMSEDGVLTLNKDEATLNPLIREIIKRDKGGKIEGDMSGQKKEYAFREFKYVYYTCDFDAYPSQHGLSTKAAHSYAIKEAELPEAYEPDEVIRALMKQYRREHLTPSKEIIIELVGVFSFNLDIVKSIRNNLQNLMNNSGLTKDQISELIKYQQQLLDVSTEIPNQVKKLRQTLSLVQEEEQTIQIRRGGEEVDPSMRPDNAIG